MTSTSLRATLARLARPVDVDAVEREVDAAVVAVERERDALLERLQDGPRELAEAASDVQGRAQTVAEIDDQTSQGVLGSLLASVDEDGVEQTRARAAGSLAGSLAVLDHRIEDVRGSIERLDTLSADAEYGASLLEALGERASGGGLDSAVVSHIGRAASALDAVPASLLGLGSRLDGPLTEATVAADHAAAVLTRLRSGVRASTLGESLLDRVVPQRGAFSKLVRDRAAAASPWIDDPDREGAAPADVAAALDSERASVRVRARRDAEAKRAAMAELDALDDDW